MSQNGSTWLIPNRFLKEEYAGRHQCVKVFFTAASLAVLGSTVLAMIFFLVDRERLSPANCSPGHNGKMVCDSFGLMSFIGSVCFFTIWTPLGFLMFARYLPLRLQQYQFGQSIWTRIFIAVPILVGLAIFSFGVILITRSHTDWVYWTVAYTALVIGGTLGLFLCAVILAYLSAVLVYELFQPVFDPEDDDEDVEAPRARHHTHRKSSAREETFAASQRQHKEHELEKRQKELDRRERELRLREDDMEDYEADAEAALT